MHRRILFFLLLIAIGVHSAKSHAQELTQRQWLTGLVESLGWSFGLPDEPELAHYLRILEGRRSLRIEAEEFKQPGDVVSIKSYGNFGPFSGEGWVSGVAEPTTVRLRFLLPFSGTYRVSAALRLPEHTLKIGDKSFAVDGGDRFSESTVGEVKLTAGMQEITVLMPPNGAIDYIELQAPAHVPVEPVGGWQPEAPLSIDDMAVTIVQAMGLLDLLPETGRRILSEAESARRIDGADATKVRYLGTPSGGRWLRAGTESARVIFSVSVPAPQVYRLLLTAVGDQPLAIELDGRYRRTLNAQSYLAPVPVGAFPLERGDHRIEVTLPPRTGIDNLILEELSADHRSYRRLAGLGDVEDPPTPALVDRIQGLLATFGSLR